MKKRKVSVKIHLIFVKSKAKQYFKEAINMSKNEVSFLMMAKISIKEGNNSAAIEILSKAAE